MSINEKALDEALIRIKEFGQEKPVFKEEVLEAVLLIDLFRDVLGFDCETAKRQQPYVSSDKRQTPDIILLNLTAVMGQQEQNVFVEIKRFGLFEAEHERIKALEQALKYSIDNEHSYGIVTDGVRWTYFVVTAPVRSPKKKFARRVAEFSLEKEGRSARLGKMLLQRSNPSELLKLFEVLTRLHGSVTWKELEITYQLRYIEQRVERAWNQKMGVLVPASEKKLLHLMYHKDNFHRESFCYKIQPKQ